MLTDAQRAALASRLRRDRDAVAAGEIPRRRPGLSELPLSYGQEQLWFIDRFAPGLPTYNIPHALRLAGPLDRPALARALTGLMARHEALRTRLVTGASGRPVQVIDEPRPVPLELTDLTGYEPGDREARLREFLHVQSLRPFDLAAGPLLRAWLVRLSPAEHVLVIVVHHTVFDGWSAGVFLRDLAALYRGEVTGEPPGLPDLPVQFADYAVWERDRVQGAALAELESYWRKEMAGFETIHFPTDRPRPVIDSFDGAIAEHLAGRDLLDALRELSRREGTTLFVTLMAALAALLHRYTGQTDLVVGTASANRARPELAPLIGFLVNTLPVRADASGDPEFTTLLARVKDTTLGAYAHQDLPFGKLVETLGVERDLSRAPVFQIALTYAERDGAPVHAAGVDFTLTDLIVGIDAAKSDLTFLAEAREAGLWFECSYKTALFDAATVRRLLGHLEVLLRGVVADPSARLSKLPVLTEAELNAELVAWNDTAADLPVQCIHEGFEAQVAATPDAAAAEFGGESISYAELNRWASQIARRLRGLGVGPEVLVGVCMRTGLRRLAALLGIWKAGGGYVPLDPAAPADRLAFMIGDTGMRAVLTDEPSACSLPASDAVTTISLDGEWEQITALDPAKPAGTGVTPSNVAYVIYTSGSTGQPKGVVVEHRQAINFLHGMVRHWRIGPGSAVLGFAAFTFDVSVMDMFMPLLGGAKVVLAPPETLHSPPRLAALIRDGSITFACLPPAVLNLLTGERFPSLRTLLSAGEELSGELLREWLRDGLEIYNGYGPTEAAIGSTFMKLEPATPLPPPIGRPKPNYQAYVLDTHLNPVPVGVTGELHIGGAGVARGYLKRPDLTRERFIPDPFTPGQRLYKTGDLARRRPDGTIVFAGRIDSQVKIRGLRVELGEIETALAAHPAVAQAVVTLVTGASGEKQLAAYLRPAGPPGTGAAGIDAGEVRQHLARTLPTYMIPTYLVPLAEFPLTANGKIDKAALPPPQATGPAGDRVPPRTLIEAVLVDLFGTLLGTEQVGATDSFFDAGGNSLLAMQLITQLRTKLAADLDVTAVFLTPTPQQLAGLLRDKHGFHDTDLGPGGIGGLAILNAAT
jgi:amino acid adenylation domain-containing protein